ncbi:sterile alpha motif domain-containing protein 9-like [Haliotis rufescens]|uniref:sterile alpha motif domain-containing protein 9-like n=1 Tax=Haliotis rufescens TaxID=6454 RepID=UPI00201EAE4E|nr:sterile alpha motif domain-containing protein 9-like [Haliotis rufescens]XP_046338322.2 sterile alpha motif domain-containing protein 9-like [Haliotis rufescens]
MAAPRKGTKAVNCTTEKGPKYTNVQNYYLNDCSGVQIGNQNQQFAVFDDGVQLLEQPLEASTNGFTTDQVVVAMLTSILNPTHSADAPPVCLQKLEDSFNKLYGNVERKQRFKEITGLNLLPFLRRIPDKFNLSLKNSNWFVQAVPLKVIQGPQQSHVSENEARFLQRSTKAIEAAATSVTSSDDTSEEETDGEWTIVGGKKGTKAKHVIDPASTKKTGKKMERNTYASVLSGPPKQGSKRTKRVSVNPTQAKCNTMCLPSSPFQQSVDRHQVEQTQSAFETFMKEVDNFKKGHFVLVTGDLSGNTLSKSVEVLTAIPWMLVFDFDEKSRDQGLLARVEEPLKIASSLHICSWREQVKISEMATTWYFIRGYREIPETRFEKGYRDWFKQVNSPVTTLAEELAGFVQDTTVLKVVVIWNDDISKYLDYIVCKLDENIQQSIKIIICRDDKSSDNSQNDFTHMCHQVEENIAVINISAPNLFLGICDHIHKGVSSKRNYDLFEIPTANDCGNSVDKQGFAWLHEYIQVICRKFPEDSSSDVELIEEEARVFFQGGTLKWATRFLCGSEYLDVERDALGQIVEKIKNLVLSFKSGLYTLHHAPGSGGSTLAQRVLWELRDTSPCVQIHFHPGVSVGDIVSRLEYLYERTHLPIIALIDGEDEHIVRYLRRSVRQICLVVLHVKRYPYSMSEKENTSKNFWLQGNVSQNEARNLATKFGSFCKEEQRRDALKSLSKGVREGVEHQLYEFGLTAYLHEFNGIQSYVHGYLRLDKNAPKELLPWQKMLGYFSLVYYYGQTSIPCQFFAHMLGKPSNYVVSIDDFPYEVRQFVVIDTSNGKSNEMRACHYIIAKEILEQLLTGGHTTRSERSETLSAKACSKLGKFAVSFIDDASLKRVKLAVSPQAVMHMLVRTFISRDIKDTGESETQSKKRPSLAKLLVDITSKPPYTERLQVLQKLTKAFPKEPNVHAHLGRFYAMCRPNEEDKAINAFETALKLCEKKMEGKNPEEQNERLKITLSHIYHMYGMIYGQQVHRFKSKQISSKSFDEKASDLLQLAELACNLFIKCREAKPPGHEDSFGYVGEIKVRLRVCDFVIRHSGYENMHEYIAEEINSENGSQIAIFIEKSITAIDDLIIECSTVVDPADIDSSFNDAVTWHQSLLGKYGQSLEALHLPDTIGSKRFKTAAIKLKHGGHAQLDSIRSEADIKEIVASFEDIFEDAFNRGVENRKTLDIDFQEWLNAIRHDSLSVDYSLETVLSQVRKWHSMLSSPMSKFSLFVLTSIIGFGTELGNGNPECLSEAQNLKEELRKYGRWVTRSRYPREWLGNTGKKIKCLISNKVYVGNSEGEVTKVSNARRSLVVCKGTIRPPNKNKVAGFIELDLGNNYVPVHVFFVPLRTKFEGPINSGERVEFHLGFSFFNGYEAFNVKALKRYECISCGSKVEILSCEQSKACMNERCQQQIRKSDEF